MMRSKLYIAGLAVLTAALVAALGFTRHYKPAAASRTVAIEKRVAAKRLFCSGLAVDLDAQARMLPKRQRQPETRMAPAAVSTYWRGMFYCGKTTADKEALSHIAEPLTDAINANDLHETRRLLRVWLTYLPPLSPPSRGEIPIAPAAASKNVDAGP